MTKKILVFFQGSLGRVISRLRSLTASRSSARFHKAEYFVDINLDIFLNSPFRIRLTAEVLRNIRNIKMQAWEGIFENKVVEARR